MKKKNVLMTICITSFFIVFIGFMTYLIYCYALYDKFMVKDYIDYYNDVRLDKVLEHLYVDDLDNADFEYVTSIMFDKNRLEEIYDTFYMDSEIYSTFDDFVNKFYYGYFDISQEDVSFIKEGKSTLKNRSELNFKRINISNNYDESVIGVVYNTVISVEDKSLIYLDEKPLACEDNLCNIDKIFGGLHTIKYMSNGHTYFGIVNINSDDFKFNITNLDSLVLYERNEVDMSLKLTSGTYKISKCFLSSSCPNKNTSYAKLYDDGSVEYYIYITYDQAGDYYKGTYEMNNGFLTLKFKEHVYYVFDYDTKVTTKIPATTDIEYQYKITSNTTFTSDKYSFYLS